MVRILFGKPVCYKFTLLHTFTFTRTAFVNSFPGEDGHQARFAV